VQRHRCTAPAGWTAVPAATVAGSAAVGDAHRNELRLPGTQPQQVVETLEGLPEWLDRRLPAVVLEPGAAAIAEPTVAGGVR